MSKLTCPNCEHEITRFQLVNALIEDRFFCKYCAFQVNMRRLPESIDFLLDIGIEWIIMIGILVLPVLFGVPLTIVLTFFSIVVSVNFYIRYRRFKVVLCSERQTKSN